MYVCVVCVIFCHVWLWNPTDCNLQTPLCVEFSRQKYWSGLLLRSPGNLPNPGIKPGSPALPIYSFTCSFIIRWIASTFWLLWIIFYGHGCLFEIRLLIILGMCPKVELLGHMATIFLIYSGRHALVSILTSRWQVFQFVYMLAQACYFQLLFYYYYFLIFSFFLKNRVPVLQKDES